MIPLHWRKSSYSHQHGDCVEVADLPLRRAVRDSKNPECGNLSFDAVEWRAFVAAVRDGEL
ncbi:hypothetical protein HDA32_004295 [Spinactinospora alkalitolerans]|uniref:DUF397 domain-containing protein n=1 Tax=Spinactinospora alkalitolerans TaxID=687207 RepID=A0A852U0W1_9ACTN|nr:DUF397 domain-containing protein [Spinactinospora alkalitolerans]NYE49175.1 hypothetical protein [Spinactinospora alkalitolerans]